MIISIKKTILLKNNKLTITKKIPNNKKIETIILITEYNNKKTK